MLKQIAKCVLIMSLLLSLIPSVATAQTNTYSGFQVIEELAKKKYDGRQAGTKGYQESVTFLESEMKNVGMMPMFGEKQYRQTFGTGVATLSASKLIVNGKELRLMKDYMPFSRTASGTFHFQKMYYVGAGTEKDYIGDVDGLVVFHWFDQNGKFPEGALDRVQRAIKNGADGVMIISDGELKVGNYEHPLNGQQVSIPVVYITPDVAKGLGMPGNYKQTIVEKNKIDGELTIDLSSEKADNLIGIIPGKRVDKAVLYVTNMDGFGSLPDGRWYESAKSGSAAAAMMLELASRYKTSTPEYTMIFAFVGSKWKGQEGIQALAAQLNFDHIVTTFDLYAMGGNGSINQMYFGYVDKSFESFAKSIVPNARLNQDLGNALSSEMKSKTNRILFIRDDNTWVDDSMTDTASGVSQTNFKSGVETLTELAKRVIENDRKLEDVGFSYKLNPTEVTFKGTDVTLKKFESKHFHVYADESFVNQITIQVLQDFDDIYNRIATYNYFPKPDQKINVLYMKDGNTAAKIAGRKDLEANSGVAGGGFAGENNGQMYIYGRDGVHHGNVGHELNHALANANAYGIISLLQEWQGQSHIVRFGKENGKLTYLKEASAVTNALFHFEVPKLEELIRTYKTSLDWKWFTESAPNPYGHLYSYYLMGSMYAFLSDQFGENASRRAMYRVYEDVKNTPEVLIQETGLSLDEFLEGWSQWMLSRGSKTTEKVKKAAAAFDKGLTWYDYKMLFTGTIKPQMDSSGKPPKDNSGGDFGLIQNGNIKYRSGILDPKFKVTSVNVYQVDGYTNFVFEYENNSNTDFISLFDPPDGDKVMKFLQDELKAGNGTVTIRLNKEEIDLLLEGIIFTIKFGNKNGYISIPKSQFGELLKLIN